MPEERPNPTPDAPEVSESSTTDSTRSFSMSRSSIDAMIERAAERAVEHAQLAFEQAVRGKLDEHKTHIDGRLDTIDARLRALESRAPSGSQASSDSKHVAEAPSTSAQPPATPANTPRFMNRPPLSATTLRSAPPPDSAAKSWEELSDDDKRAWRLHLAGLSGRPAPPHLTQRTDGGPGNVDGDKAAKSSTRSADAAPTSHKTLECKPERLPKFDGTPSRLEEWIDRVRDVTRSNPDPSWNRAVLTTIPSVLTGAAARWHASLRDEDVEKRETVADVFVALRHAFPINRSQVRQAAHQRCWKPEIESAVDYAYDKLGLLRTAYNAVDGASKEEIELAEIVDGLPDSMRPLVRFSNGQAAMTDLVRELVEWEPVWRKVYGHPAHSASIDSASADSTPAQKAPTAGRPKTPAAAATHVSADRSLTGPGESTSRPRYDPSRIREATADQPRAYMRENGSWMRLNRPCARCGEKHFDFEHVYLKEGAKAFPIVTVGDYDVASAEEEDF
ncbi:hypothetical protein OC834_007274 [Tilletia horrida]|nr:hypothetical protein OC834_007274 [Tilletia horrida]